MLGTLWNEKLRGGLGLSFCVPMGMRDHWFERPSPRGLRLHFQGAQTAPSPAPPASLPSSTPDLVPALPHPPSEGGAESLPGCTDSPLICSPRHAALLHPWPHPSSPPPSRWGQVGAESLPGLCPTQCTQLQSLSELVAPSQTHGNQLPWKLGTLSPIQGASLSHLPETGASSVVPSCSDARLRTRLRTVSR